MNQDSVLRNNLINLIKGGEAHLPAKEILENIVAEVRTKKPSEEIKSIWEELEHLRLSQKDILEYMLKEDYQAMNWPDEYWPDKNESSDEEWNSAKNNFLDDIKKAVNLIEDENFNLFASVPSNKNHTNLREILLIADHNAYHLSKIVQLRKYFGDWR